MTQALVLIDLQNDYFGGRMTLVGADAAVQAAARLLARFRERSLPVVHIQHVAQEPDFPFFQPGTAGVEIHAAVAPVAGEPVIVKHHANGFRDTTLLDTLRAAGATELQVVGMMTHMCVDTTVRAASDLGFVCTLAADACATTHLSFAGSKVDAGAVQLAYLAALNDAFATVKTVDAILADPARLRRQDPSRMQGPGDPPSRRRRLTLAPLALCCAPRAAPAGTPPDGRRWMAEAEAMKQLALSWGDQPYGAVLVRDGRIVGHGPSRVVQRRDPDAHAEREAIRDAIARLGPQGAAGAVLYSTSRPCARCESAAFAAGVARMFHGPEVEDSGPPARR